MRLRVLPADGCVSVLTCHGIMRCLSLFNDSSTVHLQVVKMGVQYSLWGGSVLNLGTSKHRQRFFDDINMFRAPGCFAMTELKHGSNVAMLQTQAVFDVASDEWVISTPDEGVLAAQYTSR
jgi:hypothetical protein